MFVPATSFAWEESTKSALATRELQLDKLDLDGKLLLWANMLKGLAVMAAWFFVCAPVLAENEPDCPFLNDNTVLFARLRTDQLDIVKVEQFIKDAVTNKATSKPTDYAQFEKALDEQMGEAARWLREFKEAGGHEIDMVAQADTISRDGPVLIVPLSADTNSQQISALLQTGHKDGHITPAANEWEPASYVVPGKAVLYSTKRILNEFKGIVPASSPRIAEAISASGDAPEVLVMALNSAYRAALLKDLPPTILAQRTAPIVNGTDWIEQSTTFPPDANVHLVIKTSDPAVAIQISQLMGASLAMVLSVKELGSFQDRMQIVQLLTPKLKSDRVEINLASDQLAELTRGLEPLYMAGVRQSLRVESMSHMRQILVAVQMYRADHKGQYPADLDAVKPFIHPSNEDLLTNPADPSRKPAYIYLKPIDTSSPAYQQMILYESHEKFGRGVNAGFADGHVEFISNPQRFKDLLLQAVQDNGGQ